MSLLLLLLAINAGGESWPWCVPMGPDGNRPFGVTNSHWMYTNGQTFNFGTGAVTYPLHATHGPYTRWVNNRHPSATDTANTWGSPSLPRLTWPYPLGVGEVVIVESNGVYTFNNGASSTQRHGGPGTPTAPIFIVGVPFSTNIFDYPRINKPTTQLEGTWVVFEKFFFTNASSMTSRPFLAGAINSNLCIRLCFARGTFDTGDGNFFTTAGSSSGSTASLYSKNIVMWGNDIQNYGVYTNATENDNGGFIFSEFSTNVWCFSNHVAYMGGDLGRIGKNTEDEAVSPDCFGHFIFWNTTHHNGENGLDVKKACGWVFYDNDVHTTGFISSGGSQVTSIHYYSSNGFAINNYLHDAPGTGLYFSGQNGDIYAVGNVFARLSSRAMYPDRGGGDGHFHHNTIWRCNDGILGDSAGMDSLKASGNLIVNITNSYLTIADSGFRSDSTVSNENYFESGGAVSISWGATYNTVSAWLAGTTVGDGSIEADPLFVDSANNDFRVIQGSPCINAGENSWLAELEADWETVFGQQLGTPKDINGNARVLEGVVDIGAHEFVRIPNFNTVTAAGKLNISPGTYSQ